MSFQFSQCLPVHREIYLAQGWVQSKKELEIVNPATQTVLGKAFISGKEEVDKAFESAQNALSSWADMPVQKRISLLRPIKEIFIEEQDYLASLACLETGKPKMTAVSELAMTIGHFSYIFDVLPRYLKDQRIKYHQMFQSVLEPSNQSKLVFQPKGIVLVISPWNYPFILTIPRILMAIMAGNVVLFKPAKLTLLLGIKFAEIFEKLRLPPGVFQVINGDSKTGEMLVEGPVSHIVFTGSTGVGKKIAESAARRLISYGMELGGKDAAIVCKDADLEYASNGILYGGFMNSGQTCISIERIYVPEAIYDKFLTVFIPKVQKLRVGQGFDPNVEIGPLASEEQFCKVVAMVEDAKKKGAKVLAGGESLQKTLGGFFYSPTILTDVRPDMDIFSQEVFGPVCCVYKVKDEEESIRLANANEYGLGATIWTKDKKRGEAIAKKLQTGMAWVNDWGVSMVNPESPWGGIKQSGVGRSHSCLGLQEFVNIRSISIDKQKTRGKPWWFPFDEGKLQYFEKSILFLFCRSLKKKLKVIFVVMTGFFRYH